MNNNAWCKTPFLKRHPEQHRKQTQSCTQKVEKLTVRSIHCTQGHQFHGVMDEEDGHWQGYQTCMIDHPCPILGGGASTRLVFRLRSTTQWQQSGQHPKQHPDVGHSMKQSLSLSVAKSSGGQKQLAVWINLRHECTSATTMETSGRQPGGHHFEFCASQRGAPQATGLASQRATFASQATSTWIRNPLTSVAQPVFPKNK